MIAPTVIGQGTGLTPAMARVLFLFLGRARKAAQGDSGCARCRHSWQASAGTSEAKIVNDSISCKSRQLFGISDLESANLLILLTTIFAGIFWRLAQPKLPGGLVLFFRQKCHTSKIVMSLNCIISKEQNVNRTKREQIGNEEQNGNMRVGKLPERVGKLPQYIWEACR